MAQTVEFETYNCKTVGSNPTSWTIFFFKGSYPGYMVIRIINKDTFLLFTNIYNVEYLLKTQFYYRCTIYKNAIFL